MDEKIENNLKVVADEDVISINDRKRLSKIQQDFPKIDVIIGKRLDTDKPVPVNHIDLEHDRQKIFDAATESIMGQRVDRLEKRAKFPVAFITFVFGLMSGVALTYLAFNMFVLAPK